tara:strand:+ start:2412 stop:2681 length:270 start_codon:yes stop_codon:yes gene_type:complete
MKITKGRLKEIIKEELAAENTGRVSLGHSGLEPFPTLATPATPETPGHDHFITLKTLYGAAKTDGLPQEFLLHISTAARALVDYLEEQG